jgi:hypothetical protein
VRQVLGIYPILSDQTVENRERVPLLTVWLSVGSVNQAKLVQVARGHRKSPHKVRSGRDEIHTGREIFLVTT